MCVCVFTSNGIENYWCPIVRFRFNKFYCLYFVNIFCPTKSTNIARFWLSINSNSINATFILQIEHNYVQDVYFVLIILSSDSKIGTTSVWLFSFCFSLLYSLFCFLSLVQSYITERWISFASHFIVLFIFFILLSFDYVGPRIVYLFFSSD